MESSSPEKGPAGPMSPSFSTGSRLDASKFSYHGMSAPAVATVTRPTNFSPRDCGPPTRPLPSTPTSRQLLPGRLYSGVKIQVFEESKMEEQGEPGGPSSHASIASSSPPAACTEEGKESRGGEGGQSSLWSKARQLLLPTLASWAEHVQGNLAVLGDGVQQRVNRTTPGTPRWSVTGPLPGDDLQSGYESAPRVATASLSESPRLTTPSLRLQQQRNWLDHAGAAAGAGRDSEESGEDDYRKRRDGCDEDDGGGGGWAGLGGQGGRLTPRSLSAWFAAQVSTLSARQQHRASFEDDVNSTWSDGDAEGAVATGGGGGGGGGGSGGGGGAGGKGASRIAGLDFKLTPRASEAWNTFFGSRGASTPRDEAEAPPPHHAYATPRSLPPASSCWLPTDPAGPADLTCAEAREMHPGPRAVLASPRSRSEVIARAWERYTREREKWSSLQLEGDDLESRSLARDSARGQNPAPNVELVARR
jgi:hypothetical protein